MGKGTQTGMFDIAMPDFDGLNLGMWLCENCPETYFIHRTSQVS